MAKTIDVNLQRASFKYSIEIGEGGLAKLPQLLKSKLQIVEPLPKIFIVSHHHLNNLYGVKLSKALTDAGFTVHTEQVNVGESIKTWATAEKLLTKIIELKLGRQGIVLALGGGVIGDLSGFAASVYTRGIKVVQLPTTLLSMVDSSIGGKTGVNLGLSGKNLVGSFYQPSLVVSDLSTLQTLPEVEWKNGLSEVLKYAFIKEDGGLFFKWLQENKAAIVGRSDYHIIEYMVNECVKSKAFIVTKDELETGDSRVLLNLGHTFGHSLEAASRYRIAHGEAVSMGVCLAAGLGLKLNKISSSVYESIINQFKSFGLPHFIDAKLGFTPQELIRHFEYDKKNEGNTVKFIVPSATIGRCEVVKNVSETLLKEVFADSIH